MKILPFIFLALFVFVSEGGEAGSREINEKVCRDTQKCINKASFRCWMKFHEKNSNSSNAMLRDLFQCFPRSVFTRIVMDVEGKHFPNMTKSDEQIGACMRNKGHVENVDFCADFRVTKSVLPENEVVQEKWNNVNPDDACWAAALDACMEQYNTATEAVNEDLHTCSAVETNENAQTPDEIEANEATEIGREIILDIFSECKSRLEHLIETMKQIKRKQGGSEDVRARVRKIQNLVDMLGIPDSLLDELEE